MAVSGGYLYIAVGGNGNDEVSEYTMSGALVTTSLISGNGSSGIAVCGSNLFASNGAYGGDLGQYTTAGAMVSANILSPYTSLIPASLAATSDALYFITIEGIGEYTLTASKPNLNAISDPNGPGYLAAMPLSPGDANGDGRVDINDLTIVLANYNQTGMTWSQGEFTGDGTVDINDLTIVLANYNTTYATGPAAAPEPSSVVLLGVGVIGLLAVSASQGEGLTGYRRRPRPVSNFKFEI
jgi:hypothetical protein